MMFAAVFGAASCGIPQPVSEASQKKALKRSFVGLENGTKLSVLSGGAADGHRLILVHGTPGDAEQWADYLIAPPQGFEVIAVDRPGFGESGPEGPVTSLKAQAAALLPLLKGGLRDGRKAILLGHSLGGPIVAQAALDYPDQVGAVIIAAGSLDPSLEEIHWAQYLGDAWPMSGMLPRAIHNANQELLGLKSELELLAPRLKALKVPVVIVHGTEDDLVPFANVAFMKRAMTGTAVEVMTLTGMNHFLPWGAMDAMRQAIARARVLASAPLQSGGAPNAEQ